MRPVIILFAKAPLAGHVKTRLIPPLCPSSAALLHTAFVHDMIERLQPLSGHCDIELHTDMHTEAWSSANLTQAVQCEGDLGLKIFQALRQALSTGHSQAMIVGADSPTLPIRHLETLFQFQSDVALGPAEDGGFYAIASRTVSDRMFESVVWSEADVLEQTTAAVRGCGLSVELGLPWWDVDTPADLTRLIEAGDLPRHTAQALALYKA